MVLLTSRRRAASVGRVAYVTGASRRPFTAGGGYMRDNFNARRRRFTPSPRRPRSAEKRNEKRDEPWVPAPARTRGARRQPARSFPLCLVCDRSEAAEEAADRRAEAFGRAAEEVRAQRLRVLKELWDMGGGDPDMKLRKWHEILAEQKVNEDRRRSSAAASRLATAAAGVHASGHAETGFRPIRSKKNEKQEEKLEEALKIQPETIRQKKKSKREKNKNIHSAEKPLTPKLSEKESIGHKSQRAEENDEKALESNQEKRPLSAEKESDSTSASITLSSRGTREKKKEKKKHAKKKKDAEERNGSTSADASVAADFFAGLVIDELKRENAALRAALDEREAKLRYAADAVREAEDENARLAQRLEETEARARDQAEEWGQRLQDDERRGERLAAALKTRVAQLEDVATRPLAAEAADLEAVRVLRSQLEASEERRRRLEDYVTRIRQSYAEAFGDKVL